MCGMTICLKHPHKTKKDTAYRVPTISVQIILIIFLSGSDKYQ